MLSILRIAVIVINEDFVNATGCGDIVGCKSEAVIVVEGFMAASLRREAGLVHLHIKIGRVFDEFVKLCGLRCSEVIGFPYIG